MRAERSRCELRNSRLSLPVSAERVVEGNEVIPLMQKAFRRFATLLARPASQREAHAESFLTLLGDDEQAQNMEAEIG